jgi:hypothetical protein
MEVSHCLPALTPTGHRVRALRWPRCHRRRCRVGMEQDDSMHRLRLNSSSSPCVCIFRFIAMAVRRHSTYRPRFVPVQDAQRRHGARSHGQGLRWRLGSAPRHPIRLPPLPDPADACPMLSPRFIRFHGAQGGDMFARRFADEVHTFDRLSIAFATVERRRPLRRPW